MSNNNKFFLPYQQRWINNNNKYSIYTKSRRIGATYAESLWSVRRRLTSKLDHIFVSANLNTAREFIYYAKKFAEVINVVQPGYIDLGDSTSECVRFPNGARIYCVSSNPTALRGLGGDITIDEYAHHEQAEELYTASQPVITWGGQMRIISTPTSRDSAFNRIIDDAKLNKNSFKVFHTDIYEAVNEGLAELIPGDHQQYLPDKEKCRAEFIANIRRNCLSDFQFAQEYECRFMDVAGIISELDYQACVIPNWKIEDFTPPKAREFYMGYDPARSEAGDSAVLWVIARSIDPSQSDDRLKVCYPTTNIIKIKGMPFEAQREILVKFILAGAKRLLIEKNGLGMQMSESLERQFPNVTAFNQTNVSKQIIYERLSGFVSSHRFGLPEDAEMKKELTGIQRINSQGRIGYTHSDIGIAAALALEAAEGNPTIPFELIKRA